MKQYAANGSFKKPTSSFSQISNSVLQNRNLSLKAKGLFALIASYITLPGFILYKDFIKNNCSEGRTAFNAAWKELTGAGYLIHKRSRKKDGTFSYEYVLSVPSAQDTQYVSDVLQENKNTSLDNISKPSVERQDNTLSSKKPLSENKPPVLLYINNTNKNNIKSINQDMIDKKVIYKKYAKQINTQEILLCFESNSPNRAIVPMVLDFIVEAKLEGDSLNEIYLNQVDECLVLEFIEHIKTISINKVRYPIPYLKRTFYNFVRESISVLTTAQ